MDICRCCIVQNMPRCHIHNWTNRECLLLSWTKKKQCLTIRMIPLHLPPKDISCYSKKYWRTREKPMLAVQEYSNPLCIMSKDPSSQSSLCWSTSLLLQPHPARLCLWERGEVQIRDGGRQERGLEALRQAWTGSQAPEKASSSHNCFFEYKWYTIACCINMEYPQYDSCGIVNWLKLKFALKAEAELRHIRLEKDKYQSEDTRKVEHVGGDFDKLTVN